MKFNKEDNIIQMRHLVKLKKKKEQFSHCNSHCLWLTFDEAHLSEALVKKKKRVSMKK